MLDMVPNYDPTKIKQTLMGQNEENVKDVISGSILIDLAEI